MAAAAAAGAAGGAAHVVDVPAAPVLPSDVLQEVRADGHSRALCLLVASPSRDSTGQAVPGNIRRARFFVNFLQTFVEHLGRRLKARSVTTEGPRTFFEGFQARHAREMHCAALR
jgi:hypothetical protein